MSDEQRRPATRLLLPAAFTIAAGIGLALGLADEAQAAEGVPSPLAEITQPVADLGRQLPVPVLPKAAPNRQAAKPPPHPVRDIVDHTVGTADDTVRRATRTVKHVTDVVDDATAPLPVVGRTIDKVTDSTDAILDTAPAVLEQPRPPRPADLVDVPDLTDGGSAEPASPAPAAATTPAVAPQTAPGPVREQPPLVTAGPSADLSRGGSHTARAGAPLTAGQAEVSGAYPAGRPPLPTLPDSVSVSGASTATSSPTTSYPCLPMGRWSIIPSWQHAITTYIADRDGRTEPPSPPSG